MLMKKAWMKSNFNANSRLLVEIVLLLLSRVNPISSNKFPFAALLKIRFDVHFLKREVDESEEKRENCVNWQRSSLGRTFLDALISAALQLVRLIEFTFQCFFVTLKSSESLIESLSNSHDDDDRRWWRCTTQISCKTHTRRLVRIAELDQIVREWITLDAVD